MHHSNHVPRRVLFKPTYGIRSTADELIAYCVRTNKHPLALGASGVSETSDKMRYFEKEILI